MPLLALGASDCEAFRAGLLGQPANAVSSLAYVVAGLWVLRRGGPAGPAVALALVGVGSVLYHGPMSPGAGLAHDGSIAALAGAAAVVAWRRRQVPRPPVLAVAALGAAVAVNLLTRTGAPLCLPSSLLQGHGTWHVLTAVAAASWLAAWHPRRPPGRDGGADRGLGPPVSGLRRPVPHAAHPGDGQPAVATYLRGVAAGTHTRPGVNTLPPHGRHDRGPDP